MRSRRRRRASSRSKQRGIGHCLKPTQRRYLSKRRMSSLCSCGSCLLRNLVPNSLAYDKLMLSAWHRSQWHKCRTLCEHGVHVHASVVQNCGGNLPLLGGNLSCGGYLPSGGNLSCSHRSNLAMRVPCNFFHLHGEAAIGLAGS